MNRFIPEFIYKKYSQNKCKGYFNGASIFIDIAGFTSLTEELVKYDKKGSEILNTILKKVFNPIIDEIYQNKGFIPFFAGDGLTALFPKNIKNYKLYALRTAFNISLIIDKLKEIKTKLGIYKIGIKIGIDEGLIKWNILGKKDFITYFFYGSPLVKCIEAQNFSKNNSVIVTKKFSEHLNNITVSPIENNENFFKIDNFFIDLKTKKIMFNRFKKNILRKFLIDDLIDININAEFRKVISIFISFENDQEKEFDDLIEIIAKYGGYLNKIFYPKETTALILFGAPVCYENNFERSVDLILELKRIGFKFKVALSFGIVYAGIIGSNKRCEYTVIGDSVNLAWRLCEKSEKREVLIDENIYNNLKSNYLFKFWKKLKLKGKKNSVASYKIIKKKDINEFFYDNEFIGMEKELDKIEEFLKPVFKNKFAGVCYVYGDAGSGKSRLIYESMRKTLENNYFQLFTCVSDEILRQSFNLFKYFFKNYFQQFSDKNNNDKKVIFLKILDNLIKRLKHKYPNSGDINDILKEIKRTKSFLGALIGLYFKDSLYSKLTAELRFKNMILAIENIIRAESFFSPVIIHIEDIQWIDNDSKKVIEYILNNNNNIPLAIICSSRYIKHKKPEFNLKNINKVEIEINNFNDENIKEFVKNICNINISDETTKILKEKTSGYPFFIEQLLFYYIENKINPELSEEDLLKIVTIPDNIESILLARLDRLSKKAKNVVQTASVIGREFELKLLSEILKNDNSLYFKIKQIEENKIWIAINEIKYMFKHSLLRDSAYNMQLRSHLIKVHELCAQAIEKLYKNNIENYFEDLSYHYENSDNFIKAVYYIEKAALKSKKNYENDKSIYLYKKALAIYKKYNNKENIINTNINIGKLLRLIGKWDSALLFFKGALDISEEIDNKLKIAEILDETGAIFKLKGNISKAFTYYNRSMIIFEDLGDIKGICNEILSISVLYERCGEYKKAVKGLLKVIDLSEKNKFEMIKIRALYDMGIIHYRLSEYEDAIKCFKAQLNFKSDNKRLIAGANANLGTIYLVKGFLDESMEYLEIAIKIHEEVGDESALSLVLGNIGIIYILKGEYEKAMKYLTKQLKINEKLNFKEGLASVYGNIGEIYSRKGEFKRSLKFFKKSLKVNKNIKDKRSEAIAYISIGDIYKKQNDYISSEKNYNRSINLLKKMNIDNELCQVLYSIADLNYLNNKFSKAFKINEKAYILSEKSNNKEVFFMTNILKLKLEFINNNNENIIYKLLELEKITHNEENIAYLYYTIFKISKKYKYRDISIGIYEKLDKRIPNIDHKIKINEMKNIKGE